MATLDFAETSHRRLNPLTGEWTLVSPHRMKRPWQGKREAVAATPSVSHDPNCYLCPGNLRASGESNPVYPHTFVFDNDFASLQGEAPPQRIEDGLLVAEGESGFCRVLCFSPRHDLTLSQMEVADVERVVDAWVEETINLGARDGVGSVQIFENRGEIMGCSNPHPHGQIWATRHLPNELEKETRSQTDYLLRHGRVLLLDYLEQELERKERIVFTNEHFVVLTPFWAIWPFETMILPRRRIGGIRRTPPGRAPRARQRAFRPHPPLRPAVRRLVPLFDGLPSEAHGRRGSFGMADARPFLSAAPALGDSEEIYGRLRDAGLAAARPHARSGGRAVEGGFGVGLAGSET